MYTATALVALLFLQTSPLVLENDYVQVFKNSAPCAEAGPSCGERIVVALGSVEVVGQKLARGDIKVFNKGERYSPPKGGDYVEVNMKPVRPPVKTTSETIEPLKNKPLYNGERFRVFQEQLDPGDTSPRHSHNQRVVITINATRVQQWPDGQPERIGDLVPDHISFNQPVIHVSKCVGTNPIRNIIIELKP